jgi:hypothetical protein
VISWGTFIGPVLAIVFSGLAGLGYAVWRDFGARRSVAAVAAGRRVAIPLTVEADGVVRGHGVRDGLDIRILTKKHHLVVDREELIASSTRRGRFDQGLFEYAELVGLVDATGRRYYIGPPHEWGPAFSASLDAPARPAGWLWRLWAGTSRVALGVAAMALLLGAVFQGIWWSGHDVSAHMLNVVAGQEGSSCAVEWRDGNRREYADLDCYEPFPQAGDEVRARALAWPLDERALDYAGVFDFFTLAPGALALAGLIGAAGLGVRRLRRPAVRLSARARGEQAGEVVPKTTIEAEGMPFRALAAAVAEREGWGDDIAAGPPTPHRWDPILMALGRARWLAVAGLLGVAWLPESLPQNWRLALTAAAGFVLVWALWRSVMTYLAVRGPFGEPVTSEWDYWLVRTEDELWVVLLLLGDTPHWALFLAGADGHPAASGRGGIRGDLTEGGAVHVRIMDQFWVPDSPVIRVTEDFLEEMREDLVSRLVDDPTDDENEVLQTVAPGGTVDLKALIAVATKQLEQDDCFWELDNTKMPGAVTVRFNLTPELGNAAELWMTEGGELFFLYVGGSYCLHEFEYNDRDKPEMVREQVSRGLAYLDGQYTQVEVTRGRIVVDRLIRFPDGECASWQVPRSQLLRARFRGPRVQRTSHAPEEPTRRP